METRTAIESHNLSFSYGTLPVLENVSFSVPEGSYTALIGANGAGKSTLLKLLLGELTPTSGSLSLLGQPIRSFRDWPRIGYVPQGTQAGYADFPASVSEVVSAGLYKKIGLFRFANASHRKEIARANGRCAHRIEHDGPSRCVRDAACEELPRHSLGIHRLCRAVHHFRTRHCILRRTEARRNHCADGCCVSDRHTDREIRCGAEAGEKGLIFAAGGDERPSFFTLSRG